MLVSWAVPKGPSLNPKDKRVGAHVEDHPYDYGSFEGVIPKGNYGAGQVIVWDNGTYTPDEKGVYSWGDKAEGSRRILEDMAKGKISFTLRGKKLQGSWTLVQIKSDPKSWLLIKHRDEYASDARRTGGGSQRDQRADAAGPEGRTHAASGRGRRRVACSAASGRKGSALPRLRRRCGRWLATLVARSRSRGRAGSSSRSSTACAMLAFVRDGQRRTAVRAAATTQTVQYPEVVAALEQHSLCARPCSTARSSPIGEDGAPSFQDAPGPHQSLAPAEVERPRRPRRRRICIVFDVLYLDGYDLRAVPLIDRKAILRRTHRPRRRT